MFVAVGQDPAAQSPLANDPFWPAIDPDHFRLVMRIDGTVTAERVRDSLADAMLSTNGELAAWQAAQLDAGYATAASTPSASIDGEHAHLVRYRRAVYSFAAAELAERYRSFDATDDGHQYADRIEANIGDLRRAARWAISGILGIARTTVELI